MSKRELPTVPTPPPTTEETNPRPSVPHPLDLLLSVEELPDDDFSCALLLQRLLRRQRAAREQRVDDAILSKT